MSEQIIKLSTWVSRIKEIMSKVKLYHRCKVGVKSGGCAGMSYIMEYERCKT